LQSSPAEALASGRYQDAVQGTEVLLRQSPDDVRLWTIRGAALAQLNRPKESLASFHRALHTSPDFLPALKGAAQVAYTQKDPAATQFLKRIVALDPDNPTAHAMLGAIAAESKDCHSAVPHFEKARYALQNNFPALIQFGNCLNVERQSNGAEKVFRQALTLKPRDPGASYKLALALRQTGNAPAAIDLLKTLPSDSHALNLLAECYQDQKNPQAASMMLRRAIALAPDEEQNYVDLGALYIEQQSPLLALDVANQGLRELPRSARLYTIRGAALTWLNEPDKAALDFEKADQLEPDQLYGSVGLSMLLRQTERLAQAVTILRQKLAERPNDATLNYLLADTLIRAGAEPKQPSFEEAIRLLRQSIELDPSLQRAYTTLGKLYLRAGKPEEAAAEFRRVVQINPRNRSALTQLLLVLRKLGKDGGANAAAQQLRLLIVAEK
jgi:tetratricopeptide (TPR) repeat protein